MARSQLNINIDPALLLELKEKARIEGKTVTSFISELLSKTLKSQTTKPLSEKVTILEEKIDFLEDKINKILSPQKKITPFNNSEAKNCSEFIRALFYKQIKRSKIDNRKQAYEQLLSHIKCFHQWDDFYSLRLKEVLFIDDYEPFSSSELNSLTTGKECPCPIRTGLINWINDKELGKCSRENEEFPSQQEICDEGPKILGNIF